MNILFLSRWFPYPADNGAKLRIYNLLKQLASQNTVDLISFTSEPVSETRLVPLQSYCRFIKTIPYRPFKPQGAKAILGLLSPLPRSVLDTDNAEMHSAIQRKVQETPYDLVIASQVDMAQYAHSLPGVKILEEIELDTLRDQAKANQNLLAKLRHGLMWQKWTRYISNMMCDFNGGTVVSKVESKLVVDLLHKAGCTAPIKIIPNGVDIANYQDALGKPESYTLVYSGALTYYANFDAMEFFLGKIFPLIQEKCPHVKLAITGQLKGVPIARLPRYPGVVFTDYIEDIRPTIASSWASIVPLRYGGGTRLKIFVDLALGTPVVSTSKGAEGLELAHDQDILIADSPADFATAVLRLLDDPLLRQTLSRNGRRLVEAQYAWQTIGQTLNEFIREIIKG